MDRFETALYSNDFRDPEKGYRPLVDSVSLANLYLCTELCANIDGFFSTYLYKKANDQKLYFGPLWDYDIAYGNDSRKGDTSRLLMVNDGYGAARVWFVRMWRDPWFRQLILRRWTELKERGVEQHLLAAVDSMAAVLEQSQALNFEKYDISKKVYNERVMHNSYAEYVTDLKTFITAHTAYLDQEFAARATADFTDASEFQLITNYYYRVRNAGVGTHFDVVDEGIISGSKACLWGLDKERRTQQWSIRKVGDAYQFINRASGLALNAPSGDLDTQLDLVEPNEKDEAQLWQIPLVDEDNDYFNIINKKYTRTANVSGGSSSNGTALICWKSDEDNKTSAKRQWYIEPDEINSDSIVLTGDIKIMVTDTIAVYRQRMSEETAGTDFGQVSQDALDIVEKYMTDAETIIAEDRLNLNLAHTYIYYIQRAWKDVLKSRVNMNYLAEGNYRLFWTPVGASVTSSANAFTQNDDSPWGYYAYNVENGTYDRFTSYDNKGKCGSASERGKAWYRASEYCFVSSTGHFHPCTTGATITLSSPAVVFTAPADGIYFATITVRRNVANQSNTLYLRSRYLPAGEMSCQKENFIFAQPYGTPEVDGSDGKKPQTLDFFIRLKKDDRFTLETEAYTAGNDASGRSIITDLSVTSCHDTDQPYTEEEAKAYPRYFNAIPDDIQLPTSLKANGVSPIFDLSGRKVVPSGSLPRGVYFQQGQKFIR